MQRAHCQSWGPWTGDKAHVAALQGGSRGARVSPTPARAAHQPSGVAHRASLVKSKVNKGKERVMGGKDSYHREGELFLSSEYKEKQRKRAGSNWVLLGSKHRDVSFT